MGTSMADTNTKILLIISKDLKAWVQMRAKQQHRTMTGYILNLIEEDKRRYQRNNI